MKTKKIIIAVLLIVVLTFTFMACKKDIEISGFNLDLNNISLELAQGQDIDLSNLKVNATRVDGTSITLNSGDFTVDMGGFNKDVAGEYTITIKYGTYDAKTFVVTVKAPEVVLVVSKIEIASNSTHKTAFAYNENFSYANLALKLTYTNGTSKIVTDGFTINSSEYNKTHGLDRAPEYLIVVNYNGETTSYSVSVAADPSKIVESIAVVGNFKTHYRYYEEFSGENVAVEITYGDDRKEVVTVGKAHNNNNDFIDFTAFNKEHGQSTEQKYNIKVSYISYEANYDVFVARAKVVDVIVIASESDKTFAFGEEFDLKNVKVYAQYENSYFAPELVKADNYAVNSFVVDSSSYTAIHEQNFKKECNIFIKYNDDMVKEYKVVVDKAPVFTTYRVKNGSTHQTVFAENELFNSDGLIVEAVYGSELGDDLFFRVETPTITHEGYNSGEKGFYPIFAYVEPDNYYFLYTVEVAIDSNKAVTGIVPHLKKTSYFVGDSLDLMGSYIDITYDDNSTLRLFLNNEQKYHDMVTGFVNSPSTTMAITFNFGGKTAEVTNVSVSEDEVTNIYIPDNSKHRIQFYLGEDFNSDGLVVIAQMLSGKNIVLSAQSENIPEGFALTVEDYAPYQQGTYEIIVTYGSSNSNYLVYVESFALVTEPTRLIINFTSSSSIISDANNSQWNVYYNTASDATLHVELGDDTLSTISVMRGQWYFGSVFLPMTPSVYGGFNIYYDGINATDFTIRVTDATGYNYYSYLTIQPEKMLFASFTVNGEQVELLSTEEVSYVIKDASNNYVFDWILDDKYEIETFANKQQIYKIKELDYGSQIAFIIKLNNTIVASYNIRILPCVLISSVTVDSVVAEVSEYGEYVIVWQNYDISASYSFDIATINGYNAVLTYRGVCITSISGDILFAGINEFIILVNDSQGKQVTMYVLLINVDFVADDMFNEAYWGEELAFNGLTYTANSGVGSIKNWKLVDVEQVKITFALEQEVTVSIKGSNWTNGQLITLQQGKNEFILIFSKGIYSYHVYMIIYRDYHSHSFGHDPYPTINGVEIEDSYTMADNDTYIIRIPAGFEYTTNIASIIDMKNSDYTYKYRISNREDNLIGSQIIVTVSEGEDVIGYGYILVITDGDVNDNTLVEFAFPGIWDMMNNIIEFSDISFTLNENGYTADINVEEGSFIFTKAPYFATAEVGYSNHEAVVDDGGFSMIIAEVGTTFTVTTVVTSSPGVVATYILTITVVAAPVLFTLDFGDKQLDYTLYALYMMSSESGGEGIVVEVDLNELASTAFNEEEDTVTFKIISDSLYDQQGEKVGQESITVGLFTIANYILVIDDSDPYGSIPIVFSFYVLS